MVIMVHPKGRTILTRDVDVNCMPPTFVAKGVVAHCWMAAAKLLLKMEAGCLAGPHPRRGAVGTCLCSY